MSPQERVRAVLKSKAGTSAKIVLIAIADRMIDTRLWAWCGPGDIQKRTSLGERQTRTLLGELMADGILTRETRDTEHGEREGYVIDWARLSAVEPAKTARGGKREPTAKTAGEAANIAGSGAETTGKDCRGVRQTLPGEAAKTAETTGKDCNRSGNEAVSEAVHEAEGGREGASLTTPPTSDPAGSVPPADLTSACEGSYAPTTDPTPEHVNETNAGDRAEGGDVPRVASGHLFELAPVVPAPTPPPEPAPTPRAKRAPKAKPTPDELADAAAEAKREEERRFRAAGDAFGEAFTATFGTRYPWNFTGRYSDRAKIREWVTVFEIARHPERLADLRNAALAYCRAAKVGAAFPKGDPPTTKFFTEQLAVWRQKDPNETPRLNGRPDKGRLLSEAFEDNEDPTPDRIVIDATWS